MKRALILVDIQNDFVPGGALPVPAGDAVVPVANRLQPAFEIVVATQDWHPPDHGSFVDQHPGTKPGEVIEFNGLPQVLWPVHCVRDTPGAALASGLETRRIQQCIHKGTDPALDSYSGFFANDHLTPTGLEDYLKSHDVDAVFILGLATEYCVKATAVDAARIGFRTHLVIDGCRGIDLQSGDVDRAMEEAKEAGVEICREADLIRSAAQT